MNKVWSLYKALLNVQYGWSAMKFYYIKKRQRIWEPALIVLGLGPALGFLIYGLWQIAGNLYDTGMMFGQPHIVLTMGAVGVQIMTLFLGFFYVLSGFYFSNDLEILVPLPYKSWEVLTAKLLTIMTGQYIPIVIIALPIWIQYALRANVGLPYWISALFVFLALPILPLIIATVLTIVMMRFVNISGRKDLLSIVGGFILLLGIVGVQLYLQIRLPNADPQELLLVIMNRADGFVHFLGRFFPPSVWATNAMAYAHRATGWWNLLLFLGVTLAAGVGLWYIGERVFYQGVMAGMESGRRSNLKQVEASKLAQPRPVVWSTALAENKLFLRNPGYVLNGLVGYVLFPILAIVPLFTEIEGQNPLDLLPDVFPPELAAGGIALFFLVMSAISSIPVTTFSREGKFLWISRTFPLAVRDILAGRILAAQLINVIGCVVGVIPVSILLGFDFWGIVGGCALGVLLSTGFASLLVLLDLARPMLNWTDPIKAIKSNLNVIFGMGIAVILVFVLGLGMYLLMQIGAGYLIPVEIGAVTAILLILYNYLVGRFADARWAGIEGGIQ